MSQWKTLVLAVMGLIIVCVAGRLLPHPHNWTPIAAGALFAGFLLRKRFALSVVVCSMLISDWVIGMYDLRIMAVTYVALMLPVFLGPLTRGRFGALRVGACSLGCTAWFFLATNLAVWAFSGIYPHSYAGLIACYAAALPFLGYTLCGDLFWNGVFFGGHAVWKAESRRPEAGARMWRQAVRAATN